MKFIERWLHKLLGIYYVPDESSAARKRAIRELQNMTDKELDDIGVRRCDIRSRVMGMGGDL
jgi:uncharacterized protein YjiS (DUF1127 family)